MDSSYAIPARKSICCEPDHNSRRGGSNFSPDSHTNPITSRKPIRAGLCQIDGEYRAADFCHGDSNRSYARGTRRVATGSRLYRSTIGHHVLVGLLPGFNCRQVLNQLSRWPPQTRSLLKVAGGHLGLRPHSHPQWELTPLYPCVDGDEPEPA